ncbi:MAG TPA: UxaA family hydrolase [Verrucomicrobiae bacterium]
MQNALPFHLAGRLPAAGDNVAIASQRLDAGTVIDFHESLITIRQTVLEGHRFAIKPIASGEKLLSWGLTFGFATQALQPGDYLCNEMMLTALQSRRLDFPLPSVPNFRDYFEPYTLDRAKFRPGKQISLVANPRTFMGFGRGGNRGAGTRNYIILLGTSSRTASFVRALEERVKPSLSGCKNLDGIVAIAHTEGGGEHRPNNYELILRTLGGFMTHCNVVAVLAVDYGTEPVNNRVLEAWLHEHKYPIDAVAHRFHTLQGSIEYELRRCTELVKAWVPEADKQERTPQSIKHLNLSLQCGGSDAFSGVSGNPLEGWIVNEVLRNGGKASLAETDELVGAESYILNNVRDLPTAEAFLDKIARFEERVRWHGASSQTNPSGGNLYRGLYNIAIKSIGASHKKAPDTRLDYVIDYGHPMPEPGFYFMDSPGNDLESVAGQMASGCNLTLFSTGNGSITNFPFVPTIKIMTNSNRFRLLSKEMDINAGRYLDGESFESLGDEAFEQTLRVASGELTAGERAGHGQVQLWREWQQTQQPVVPTYEHTPILSGKPIVIANAAEAMDLPTMFNAIAVDSHLAANSVRLIQPTSLCAAQVALMITDKLSQDKKLNTSNAPRFVTLPHTEGCGVSGEAIDILERTMAGYLQHPSVSQALLLEHGCEKTHNDTMRQYLKANCADLDRYGWASIQMDGGIDAVSQRVTDWFAQQKQDAFTRQTASIANLRVGIGSVGSLSEEAVKSIALIVQHLISHGASVVIAKNASLLTGEIFGKALGAKLEPTLAYAQKFHQSGLHVMEGATDHWVEMITGLGATGVEIILGFANDRVLQGHPLLPVVQVTENNALDGEDVDVVLASGETQENAVMIFDLLIRTAGGHHVPTSWKRNNVDFQVSRGLFGVST